LILSSPIAAWLRSLMLCGGWLSLITSAAPINNFIFVFYCKKDSLLPSTINRKRQAITIMFVGAEGALGCIGALTKERIPGSM